MRRRALLAGGALVVVLAVVAGALWVWGGLGDGGGGDPKRAARPRVLTPAWQRSDYPSRSAPLRWWNAGGVFADRLSSGTRGVDARTGKLRWKLRLPRGAGALCGLSDQVNGDGVGAALFRPAGEADGACSLAAAIDAKTGEALWTASLGKDHEYVGDASAQGVTLDMAAGPKVITFNSRRGPVRFTAADGKRLAPMPTGDDECTVATTRSQIGTRYALLTQHCPAQRGGARDTAREQPRLYDLESGKRLARAHGDRSGTIVSEDPLVVLRSEDDAEFSRLDTYDTSGRRLRRIALADNGLSGRTTAMHFTDGLAVLPAEGAMFGTRVIDLESGRQLWQDKGSKKRTPARPVGIDGDRVIAVADGAGDAGQAEVVTYGLRDGKRELVGRVRGDSRAVRGVDISCEEALWQDGMLFLRDARGDAGKGWVTRAFRFD